MWANVSKNSLAGNFHGRDGDTRKDTLSNKKGNKYAMMCSSIFAYIGMEDDSPGRYTCIHRI